MYSEEIQQIVYRQLIGKATETEKTKLQQWIDEDESHREWYQNLISRNNLVERYQAYHDTDAEGAWARFDALKYPKRKFKLRSVLKYAAVALVLIVGIGVYLQRRESPSIPPTISEDVKLAMQHTELSGRNHAKVEKLSAESISQEKREILTVENNATDAAATDDDSETGDWLRNAQRATTYHDKEFWLTLSDGTVVHLNYNTRIIYPEKFVGDTREVILSGDAYFMVAHDDSHPFIVHTSNGTVKVYGTEFMVETNGKDGSTHVALVKGSVGVTPNKGTEQIMRPGQLATINAQNGQCSLQKVDTYPYVAWNTGTFSFNNANLEDVMDILSRWYNVDVAFANDKRKQEKLYGDFDRYESLDNILSAIQKSTGIHIERVKNKLIIK